MSLWEFNACVEGYRRANSTEDEPLAPPTREEFHSMIERFSQLKARRAP